MLVKEYRIIMPMTIDEYSIGQLFTITEFSKQETGDAEGVEVLRNEYFEDIPLFNGQFNSGQYTHKVYHIKSKIPSWIRMFVPSGLLHVHEHAWNCKGQASSYCRTELYAPEWDEEREKFSIIFDTLFVENDRGTIENALQLEDDILRKREVIFIDIAHSQFMPKNVEPALNPTKFRSRETRRGPLLENWQLECQPVMCIYKVATIKFKRLGFQSYLESKISNYYLRLFARFHRVTFCLIDKWHGMTMEQIRELEERTREELERARARDNDN